MSEYNELSKILTKECKSFFRIYRRDSELIQLEKVFRKLLTPDPETISQESDPLPRLQYFPEYITDLIQKKKYLKKQCEENSNQDHNYPIRYDYVRQEIRARIRYHAAILKHLDIVMERKPLVSKEEKNHFSTSLDTDRVQSFVNYFRQHENDPFLLSRMLVNMEFTKDLGTQRVLEDKSMLTHQYYFWYAIYATYEDFVLTPPIYRQHFRYNHLDKTICYMTVKENKKCEIITQLYLKLLKQFRALYPMPKYPVSTD